MKRPSNLTSVSARQALGVAGILGLIALTLCSNQNIPARFRTVTHAKPEDSIDRRIPHSKANTLQFHPTTWE
jgi:hypothetical protein